MGYSAIGGGDCGFGRRNLMIPFCLLDVKSGFAEVKAAGFDVVHTYESDQSLFAAKQYLEAATDAGLQVAQNMPWDHLGAGDAFWIQWITELSSYENLLWWYLPEEPNVSGFDYAQMSRLYELVQEHDPQRRPSVLYFGTSYNMNEWCDVGDIVAGGCYPEKHEAPRACMWNWMDLLFNTCPNTRPVIATPAFFDANAGEPGGYPSAEQARFDVYAAIIAGATGLLWYSHFRGWGLVDLRTAIQDIIRELKQLAPIIESTMAFSPIGFNVLNGPETVSVWGSIYDSIQVMQRAHASGQYVLACNLAETPVQVRFNGLSEGAEVTVVFENRIISATNGIFDDMFVENAVHIYRWAKEDAMWHGYIGIENLNLNATQRQTLVTELRRLGPSFNSQPARLNHWRTRLDDEAAIFEALFDEDNLTIERFKERLGVIFDVDPATIDEAMQQTQFGPLATFSRGGTDYLHFLLFGRKGAEWMESGDGARAYLAANQDQWEN